MKPLKPLLFKKDLYRVFLAVLLVGLGAGVFSFSLHESVHFVSKNLGTTLKFSWQTFLIATVFALTSYLLTRIIFKDTNGSGIPQVKLSLVAYKGKMPRRMPFGKWITSFFTLCSGLSFGKEGPLVTISAAWGHLVSHLMGLNRQLTKVLVTSGATAGLAAAFNTPIAAVVFTIEEVLGELNTKYLGPIVMTSVIASVTSYRLLGNKATFVSLGYGFHVEWHLIFYLLLGLLMSLVGHFLVKSILMFKGLRQSYFEKYDFVFVIVAVGLVGLASQYSPAILGDGTETINHLLLGKGLGSLGTIGLILLLKLVLTSTSYSTGLSGGLFMPVLFIGAVGGHAFGELLTQFGVEQAEIGVFTLMGMTSLLVAVIRAPFTAFVMLFEMTRDYELILPLMVSSVGAYWVSTLLEPESVYESVAEYEGVHLPTHRDNECLNEMSVEECMITDVVTIESHQKLNEIERLLQDCSFGGFPVLKNYKLIGVANKCDLKAKWEEDPSTRVSEMIRYSVISIYPDQSLLIALDKMKRFEVGRLPVVSRFNDKQLLGIITPEDIVNYLGLSKSEEIINADEQLDRL